MQMRKQVILAALCAALVGATAAAVDMADWRWQVAITFDGYPAERTELVNFPALLVFEDGAGGIDFANFKEGGVDLRFTDEAESVLLNHEIESWDAESGKAWVWVQVPQLNNGTVIKAHWGNGAAELPDYATNGATWSEGFKAVWHMVADENNKLAESTANNYVGTLDSSGVGFTADGYAGGAASFASSGNGYGAVGGLTAVMSQ